MEDDDVKNVGTAILFDGAKRGPPGWKTGRSRVQSRWR